MNEADMPAGPEEQDENLSGADLSWDEYRARSHAAAVRSDNLFRVLVFSTLILTLIIWCAIHA